MSDINRKVVIEGDASGFEREIERVTSSSTDLYQTLSTEASKYTDNIRQQAQWIDKMLQLEERRLREEMKYIAVANQEEKKGLLANVKGGFSEHGIKGRRWVEEDFEKVEKQRIFEGEAAREQIRIAREKNAKSRLAANKPPIEDAEYEDVSGGSRVMGGVKKAGGAIASGLGIGFGLGVAGILYEMVTQAVQLDKSTKALTASAGQLDVAQFKAAEDIGKTITQMNELAIQVGRATGGKYTGQALADVTKNSAIYEKAFGLENGSLMKQEGTARMLGGGKTMESELYTALMRFNKEGGINIKDRNFQRLPELLDFYSRMNMMYMQTGQNVNPSNTARLMSAMLGTGITQLSGANMGQSMETINRSITNPSNDFTRAFNFQAMSKLAGGNYLDTKILEEGGTKDPRVLPSILRQLQKNFGGNRDDLALAIHADTGLGYDTSKQLSSPEKMQKFIRDLSSMGTDPNAKKRVEELMGKSPEQQARDNTALQEKLVATLNNFMGQAGEKGFELAVGGFKAAVELFTGYVDPSSVKAKPAGVTKSNSKAAFGPVGEALKNIFIDTPVEDFKFIFQPHDTTSSVKNDYFKKLEEQHRQKADTSGGKPLGDNIIESMNGLKGSVDTNNSRHLDNYILLKSMVSNNAGVLTG